MKYQGHETPLSIQIFAWSQKSRLYVEGSRFHRPVNGKKGALGWKVKQFFFLTAVLHLHGKEEAGHANIGDVTRQEGQQQGRHDAVLRMRYFIIGMTSLVTR